MNNIIISGVVEDAPIYSHTCMNEKFYKFKLINYRYSKTADVVPVIISEVFSPEISKGMFIEITGEIRTRNVWGEGAKKKLNVFVFAKSICTRENKQYVNHVEIDAFVCKEPIYRETPFGRQITDVMFACNRNFGRSDYIPCIAWGRNAIALSKASAGDRFLMSGRFQSREYVKTHEDGTSVPMTAYEVSVGKIEEYQDECI